LNPFERPANASDETVIILDADKTSLALRAAAECSHAINFVHELVGKGELSVSMRFACLSVAQSHLEKLKHTLGAKSDEEQANELNSNQLRQANIEIHRLRQEMAKGVTPEVLGLALEPLKQTVYDWWKSLGFLTMEAEFVGYSDGGYLNAKLSCYLDRHGPLFDEKPVTTAAEKRMTIEQLAEHVDMDTPRGNEPSVMDTPRTREWLVSQLQTRFPGTRIFEWHSHGVDGGASSTLRDIRISIPIKTIPAAA